jgi:cytochrome c oxidase subunit 1
MEGKKGMTPSEPIGDIHMPNSSIIPLIIALGLFIAAFGAMYHVDNKVWALPVMFLGLAVTFISMFTRSVKDDHGFHIHKEELMEDEKGARA